MPWSLLLNPTVLLGIALAGALSWGSIQTWRLEAANGRIETVKSEYAQRDAKAQAEATAALKAATDRVRAAEDKSQADVAAVSANLEAKHAKKLAEKDRVIAGLRAGSVVFHDPGSSLKDNRNANAETSAGPKQCDGSSTGQLSGQAAEFLWSLATESDQIADQLQAAQAILVKDREVCK